MGKKVRLISYRHLFVFSHSFAMPSMRNARKYTEKISNENTSMKRLYYHHIYFLLSKHKIVSSFCISYFPPYLRMLEREPRWWIVPRRTQHKHAPYVCLVLPIEWSSFCFCLLSYSSRMNDRYEGFFGKLIQFLDSFIHWKTYQSHFLWNQTTIHCSAENRQFW